MEEAQENINKSRRKFLGTAVGTAGLIIAAGPAALTGLSQGKPPEVDNAIPKPPDLSETLLRDFSLGEDVRHLIPSPRSITSREPREVVYYGKHAYECLSNLHDPDTGARAYALREIVTDRAPAPKNDRLERFLNLHGESKHKGKASPSEPRYASNELILIFPGRSDVKGTSVENAIVTEMYDGKRSKQEESIRKWTEEEIVPYLQQNKDVSASILGHSMGSGNALLTKYLLESMPSKTKPQVQTILYEPFAPTQEAGYIVRDAIAVQAMQENPRSPETIVADLRRNVTSIRVQPRTVPSRLPVGESSAGNKQFGDKAYILNPKPGSPLAPDHPAYVTELGAATGAALASTLWLRRNKKQSDIQHKVLRNAVKVAATAGVSTLGGGVGILVSDKLNSAAHSIAVGINILKGAGNDALIPSDDPALLSTTDEVLHPERYPVSRADKVVVENAAKLYVRGSAII